MWVKKTEEEINSSANPKRTLLFPIVSFILAIVIQLITRKTGMSKSTIESSKPEKWSEIFNDLPLILLYAAVAFVAVFLYELLTNKSLLSNPDKTVVCDKCNDNKLYDKKFKCSCGGTYTNIKNMKWVEPTNKEVTN